MNQLRENNEDNVKFWQDVTANFISTYQWKTDQDFEFQIPLNVLKIYTFIIWRCTWDKNRKELLICDSASSPFALLIKRHFLRHNIFTDEDIKSYISILQNLIQTQELLPLIDQQVKNKLMVFFINTNDRMSANDFKRFCSAIMPLHIYLHSPIAQEFLTSLQTKFLNEVSNLEFLDFVIIIRGMTKFVKNQSLILLHVMSQFRKFYSSIVEPIAEAINPKAISQDQINKLCLYLDVMWQYMNNDNLDQNIKNGVFKALVNVKEEIYITQINKIMKTFSRPQQVKITDPAILTFLRDIMISQDQNDQNNLIPEIFNNCEFQEGFFQKEIESKYNLNSVVSNVRNVPQSMIVLFVQNSIQKEGKTLTEGSKEKVINFIRESTIYTVNGIAKTLIDFNIYAQDQKDLWTAIAERMKLNLNEQGPTNFIQLATSLVQAGYKDEELIQQIQKQCNEYAINIDVQSKIKLRNALFLSYGHDQISFILSLEQKSLQSLYRFGYIKRTNLSEQLNYLRPIAQNTQKYYKTKKIISSLARSFFT